MNQLSTDLQYLDTAFGKIHGYLIRYIQEGKKELINLSTPPPESKFAVLCKSLCLSPFEQGAILMATGLQICERWDNLCKNAHKDVQLGHPTAYLVSKLFGPYTWNELEPQGTLFRLGLLQPLSNNFPAAYAPLRIRPRVISHLLGSDNLSQDIADIVDPIHPQFSITATAERIKAQWIPNSILQLCGTAHSSKTEIAAQLCQGYGLKLYSLSSRSMPGEITTIKQFAKQWELERVLTNPALLCDWQDEDDIGRLSQLISAVPGPKVILTRDRKSFPNQTVITAEIKNPSPSEQIHLWHNALGEKADNLGDYVKKLSGQFDLSPTAIRNATAQATNAPNTGELKAQLWAACRMQARPQLDELAQRIDVQETWQDLILPEKEKALLSQILSQCRNRMKVYEEWGLGGQSPRGKGLVALFSGLPGTGKTMAANAIAHELGLDLYKVDLSAVSSKYIGETQKNLRKIFDAAETGGVVLLFDEADSLFGKRSDVKDGRDRYANQEVSYLLQRVESYRGLAILTTNIKSGIDAAFMRRIRFEVDFCMPDVEEREQIWQRMYPAQTPVQLDYRRLGHSIPLAGGNIRNIAVSAAFIAADEDSEFITMRHVAQAVRDECARLKTMVPKNIDKWTTNLPKAAASK